MSTVEAQDLVAPGALDVLRVKGASACSSVVCIIPSSNGHALFCRLRLFRNWRERRLCLYYNLNFFGTLALFFPCRSAMLPKNISDKACGRRCWSGRTRRVPACAPRAAEHDLSASGRGANPRGLPSSATEGGGHIVSDLSGADAAHMVSTLGLAALRHCAAQFLRRVSPHLTRRSWLRNY